MGRRWLLMMLALALASCEGPPPEVYHFEVSLAANDDAPASLEVFFDGQRLDWVVNDGNFSPYVVGRVVLGDAAERRSYVGRLVVMRGGQQVGVVEVRSRCDVEPVHHTGRPIAERVGFSLWSDGELRLGGYSCTYDDGKVWSLIVG